MTRLRLMALCVLLFGLAAPSTELVAGDCICVMYPVYPYSGNDWLHFAYKTKNACEQDYALGQIKEYTQGPEMCVNAANCGTCTTLSVADVARIFASDVYTRQNLTYAELSSQGQIKSFLMNNTRLTGQELATAQAILNNEMEFASPIGNGPPIAKLTRVIDPELGTKEDFYVVLWKMRRTASTAPDWAYIGIEISNPSVPAGVTVLDPSAVFRATTIVKDEEMFQSIIIKGMLEVEIGRKVYFVRVFDATKNRTRHAFPLRAPRR